MGKEHGAWRPESAKVIEIKTILDFWGFSFGCGNRTFRKTSPSRQIWIFRFQNI